MKKAKPLPIDEASTDYKNMVDLLAILTQASNQLLQLRGSAQEALIDIMDDLRGDYAALQETVSKTEAAIEAVARMHPEWFKARKSIKTPYGEVAFRSSTSLEVENEAATIVRIQLEAQKLYPGEGDAAIAARRIYIETYVRQKESLNKEALEGESDAFLFKLGIKRIPDESFSAKPAVLDLGKAVKEAVEQEAT